MPVCAWHTVHSDCDKSLTEQRGPSLSSDHKGSRSPEHTNPSFQMSHKVLLVGEKYQNIWEI